jgi:hypothetical protein
VYENLRKVIEEREQQVVRELGEERDIEIE